jgi:Mn2+/Fe2+ NRAMP family transporter
MTNEMRNKLVAQERRNREMEARFREAVASMTTRKLTPRHRVAYGLGCILGLLLAGLLGHSAWTAPPGLPLLGRLILVVGAVFGVAWAGMSAYVLKRGSMNLRTDENAKHALMWIFMVLMMTVFLVIGTQMDDRLLGISLVLDALVFFVVFAIPAFVAMRVNRMEMQVREQLLRMEIALAEMAERQAAPQKDTEPR